MAITFDAASNGTAASASSESHSHTIGSGSNRQLIHMISTEAASYVAIDGTSMTYNGVGLTKRVEQQEGSSTFAKVELWDLPESSLPSAGSYTMASNFYGTCDYIVTGTITLSDVNQTSQPEATNMSSNASSSTSHNTNITTTTDGAWVVDGFGGGTASSLTVQDAGQTGRVNTQSASNTGGVSTEYVATATTANLGWTYSSINRVCHCLAAYAPASTGITGTLAETMGNVTSAVAGGIYGTGSLAETMDNVTSAASGTVGSGITGSLAETMDAITSAAAGVISVIGSLAETMADVTSAITGILTSSGSVAETMDDITSAGSGAITGTGTLAETMDDITCNATGYNQDITGTVNQAMDDVTSSGNGIVGTDLLPKAGRMLLGVGD